jgi:chromosome segregation and condensation protein ScpB
MTKELINFVDKAFAAHNRELDKATVNKALKPIFEEQTMIKTLFEKLEAKAGRSMVLKALRTKFKKVPKQIEQTVLAKSDPIVLESLLEQVFHCNTLDEFAEGL